jgi:hypothetical protein
LISQAFGLQRIADNPQRRYTAAKLRGGVLRILAVGERETMLAIERYLHENEPLGPEEGQSYYVKNRQGGWVKWLSGAIN